MWKFKRGDRVQVVQSIYEDYELPLNTVYIVSDIAFNGCIAISDNTKKYYSSMRFKIAPTEFKKLKIV